MHLSDCSVYIDAVINHMTGGGSGVGSDGSSFSGDTETYPGVPFGSNDFNGAAECPTADLEIHASSTFFYESNYNNANNKGKADENYNIERSKYDALNSRVSKVHASHVMRKDYFGKAILHVLCIRRARV
jgi:hypothetical protein